MGPCLTLNAYASHLGGIDECGMWGVYTTDQVVTTCSEIWTQHQRTSLLSYLAQAQSMIESVIGYPLCPTWIQEPNAPYKRRMHTRWKELLAVGTLSETVVATGTATNLTVEPATVGPLTTATTDASELVLYHPGTHTEIEPSAVTLSGGNVTFYIPRCRMVKTALANNPLNGLDFDTDANFEATVDVVRRTTDPTVQAVTVWPTGRRCCNSCVEETGTACITIISPGTGYIRLIPDTSWFGCVCNPPYVRLNYKAGLTELSPLAMDAIIRLAHSMMPEGPCGCDLAQTYWKRDRNVPDFVAPERMVVPWGFSDGAWYSWLWTRQLNMTHRKMSVI